MEFKRLRNFLLYFDVSNDAETFEKIHQIEKDVKQINDDLCKKLFNDDERLMNSFFKISKCLSRISGAKVEMEDKDVIRIFREREKYFQNSYGGYESYNQVNEIRYKYIKDAEGSKCFQQIDSNLRDWFDGSLRFYDGSEPLEDDDEVISSGESV